MKGVGSSGGNTIIEGPYGIGLLFFKKEIQNPKVFYCPSVKTGNFAYDTYTADGWPWPSIPPNYVQPPDSSSYPVRTSYDYYPQARQTINLSDSTYGDITLPIIKTASMTFNSPNPGDPAQSAIKCPVPLKTTAAAANKSVSTDMAQNIPAMNHKTGGQPYGVNALFGDGHVYFVVLGGNNRVGSFQPFDPNLWGADGPGNNPVPFRLIMNAFEP